MPQHLSTSDKLGPHEILSPIGKGGMGEVYRAREVPELVRRSMEMWVGCIAGALNDDEYTGKLVKAGFGGIGIEPTRVYSIVCSMEDARQFLTGEGIDVEALAPHVQDKFMSAFIRAVKPATKECCGPACCS
jgi:arsenite methyltransferase